jgi:hypothetical protein
MLPSQLLNAIVSACAILFLWVFFAFVYRRYRVAVLRHHLFAARDRLFERAQAGDLHFDDRAYGMVRTIINGLLRSADTLSLPTLLIVWSTQRLWNNRELRVWFDERLVRAIAQLSPAGRAAVSAAVAEAHFRVLSHVLHISVIFGPLLQLLKLVLRMGGEQQFGWARHIAEAQRTSELAQPLSGALAALDREAHKLGGFDQGPLPAGA